MFPRFQQCIPLVTLAIAYGGAAPTHAAADFFDVGCSFNPANGGLYVTLDAKASARLVRVGDEIEVDALTGGHVGSQQSPEGCPAADGSAATPTVATVRGIAVIDVSHGEKTVLTVDLSGGPFIRDSDTGSTEIPIFYDAGAGRDYLTIFGADHDLTFGSTANGDLKANLNAEEESLPSEQDPDLAMTGGPRFLTVNAGSGGSRIDASGGTGLGSPVRSEQIFLHGGAGNDTLIAGQAYAYLEGNGGDDVLIGGPGNDQLQGGPGNDRIHGRGGDDYIAGDYAFVPPGNDLIDGGRGHDTADYSQQTGLRIDLRKHGPQYTRGAGTDTIRRIEHVVATADSRVVGEQR